MGVDARPKEITRLWPMLPIAAAPEYASVRRPSMPIARIASATTARASWAVTAGDRTLSATVTSAADFTMAHHIRLCGLMTGQVVTAAVCRSGGNGIAGDGREVVNMSAVLRSFDEPIRDESGAYHARVVGRHAEDGMWEGWMEFVPLEGQGETLISPVESRQPEQEHLRYWASGLSLV